MFEYAFYENVASKVFLYKIVQAYQYLHQELILKIKDRYLKNLLFHRLVCNMPNTEWPTRYDPGYVTPPNLLSLFMPSFYTLTNFKLF